MFNKKSVPLVIVFFISAALILIFRKNLEDHGVDSTVLSWGNLFIYVVTLISISMLSKGLNAVATQVFLRNAYGGIMVKLFACAAAVSIYIFVSRPNFNKPALFACMFLYLVYTFAELSIIMKQSNAKKNVEN